MRLLFVLEHYYPAIGGTETLFRSVVKAAVEAGHEVEVITTRMQGMRHLEEVDGARIRRINCYNRYFFTAFALLSVLKSTRAVDIIHTTSYNAAIPAVIAGWWRRKPVFITFHEYWGSLWHELPFMPGWVKHLHAFYERMLLKLPYTKLVAVSTYTRDRLIMAGIPRAKLELIHNGIDYTHWRRPKTAIQKLTKDDQTMQLLYYGRLGHSKGLDILLPGLRLALDDGMDVNLTLILPSPDKGLGPHITQLIDNLSLTPHIQWIAQQPHEALVDYIQHADAVVIPSYAEGFCYVAVETMALNTPIIHSGRGALTEVIGGRHICAEDMTAQAWASVLRQAAEGNWTQAPKTTWPLSHTVEAYLALYSSITS